MEDRDAFIERLINASIERLGSQKPLAGLENRVLTRLHSRPKGALWFESGWKVAAGFAVVAIVAAAVWICRGGEQAPHLAPSKSEVAIADHVVAPNTRTAPSETVQAVKVRHHRSDGRVKKTIRPHEQQLAAAAPHLPIFPAPTPLSKEEKLLLIYARIAPPPTAQASGPSVEPLAEIKPLTISPLAPPWETAGSK